MFSALVISDSILATIGCSGFGCFSMEVFVPELQASLLTSSPSLLISPCSVVCSLGVDLLPRKRRASYSPAVSTASERVLGFAFRTYICSSGFNPSTK